jgi:spore coat protein U-like protein
MNTQFAFKQRAIKLALASALALGGAAISGQSFAAADTAVATSTVIVPIAIAKVADLSFGKFAPGAGGTVTISTSGARTVSGVIPSAIGSTLSAARFNITGDADATYSISHSGTAVLTNTTGAGNETMALTKYSDLTAGNATSGTAAAGTLSAGGTQSIYVGGQLAVASTQVAGVYTGTVIVTVEYN